MGEDAVMTLAQATTETPEPTPATEEPAASEAPAEVPAAEGTEAEPAAEGAEAAAEGAGDEGIIDTIVDAVTDVVEDIVPGEGEPAGEGETPATGETVGVADDHGEAADDQAGIATEVWLVLALAALILLAFRPAKRAILGALDSRADRIRDELEEAQRLREEAQAALANFQRRQRDAMGEAEEIIAHARAEADRLREHAAEELEATLKRREAMAMDRIAQAEAAATAEVRGVAVDVAISAAREVIGGQLDKSKANALVDDAIKDLPNKLH